MQIEKTDKAKRNIFGFTEFVFGVCILLCVIAFGAIVINFSKFKTSYALTGVFISFFVGAFFVFCFNLKRKIKDAIALTVFYVVVVLYAIEIFLPIDPWFHFEPMTPLFVDQNIHQLRDRRTKTDFVKTLRHQGIDAYPYIHPSLFMTSYKRVFLQHESFYDHPYFPLSSISNMVSVNNNEQGVWKSFETDEHGFNNNQGMYDLGPMDITLIGDSFTQGVGVTRDHNIAGILSQRFPKTINFGVPGMGPLSELAVLKEYAVSLKPKVVIWIYYSGNDMSDLNEELSSPIAAYLDPNYRQDLMHHQGDIDQLLIEWERRMESGKAMKETGGFSHAETIEKTRKTVTLARLRVMLGLQFSDKDFTIPCPPRCQYLPTADPSPQFIYILSEANRLVKSWGGKLIFVSIPRFDQVHEGVINHHYNYSLYRDSQLGGVEALKIPVLDLYPIISAYPDPLALYPYRSASFGHFRQEGYALIARSITEQIIKLK